MLQQDCTAKAGITFLADGKAQLGGQNKDFPSLSFPPLSLSPCAHSGDGFAQPRDVRLIPAAGTRAPCIAKERGSPLCSSSISPQGEIHVPGSFHNILAGDSEDTAVDSISEQTEFSLAGMDGECNVSSSTRVWNPPLIQHSVPCMGTEQGSSFPTAQGISSKANTALC